MGAVRALGIWILLGTMVPEMTKEEAVRLATAALAHDLGVSPDRIEVRRASPVDWPDAGLGCPEEGEVHPKERTPGYKVSLQADGRIFSVHVGDGRAIVCENGLRAVEGTEVSQTGEVERESESAIALPEAPKLRELVIQAREDLARRLTAAPETIVLIEISEVVWPDASLGCPQPGKSYPQVTREGHLIRLRSGKRVYRYHSGQGGAPFLCESPARQPKLQ